MKNKDTTSRILLKKKVVKNQSFNSHNRILVTIIETKYYEINENHYHNAYIQGFNHSLPAHKVQGKCNSYWRN